MTMTRPSGRPRTAGIDDAIIAAARQLLGEIGYARVTMDETAARAGTSKAAIYRRFRSKAEMLFAAAVHLPGSTPPADTGSLRGDLLELGARIRANMSAPLAREVAPRVVAEVAHSPEVARRFREVFVEGERDEISAVLARAVERGETSGEPDVDTIHRLLGGAMFYSTFIIGEPVTDEELERLVDSLVRAISGDA